MMSKGNAIPKFIDSRDVNDALSIGFETSTNVLLYGPGGHGKSQMVEAFFTGRGLKYGINGSTDSVFVKTLNGDTDEASLFGGLDFGKLNDKDNPKLTYNLSESFICYRYCVFEEIFDAPASVLTALKDCLTSKFYRNGYQSQALETRMLVGITNKPPEEISDLGAAFHALTERFPLRLEVKWESYSKGKFLQMVKAQEALHSRSDLICQVAEDAIKAGYFVSPRTVMHANRLCSGDFGLKPLKFLEGFSEMYAEIERIEKEREEKEVFDEMVKCLYLAIDGQAGNQAKLQIAKMGLSELQALTVGDALYGHWEDTVDAFEKFVKKLTSPGFGGKSEFLGDLSKGGK